MRAKSVPDVKFCLVFQCEALSVPVMRRVLGDTLRGFGVDEDSVYDILLAATEACTNVLRHSGRDVPGYTVMTSLGPVGCQVEVADEGAGTALAGTALAGAALAGAALAEAALAHEGAVPSVPRSRSAIADLPESGRGMAVMRACVDKVTLDSSPERGTVVTLRKHIRWSSDAPLRQLRAAS
jgi:serine/threonine-protein kinase RsbW